MSKPGLSYIHLGLDLGLLEKLDINIGGEQFTGYVILTETAEELKKIEDQVVEMTKKNLPHIFKPEPLTPITDLWEANKAEPSEKPIEITGGAPRPELSRQLREEIEAINAFKDVSPSQTVIATSPIPTAEQLEAQQALARMTGDAPIAEKKKRGRPKKETFTLTEPEAPKAEAATAPVMPKPPTTSDESASVLSMVGESKTLDEWQASVVEPEPIVILNLDPDFEGKPTADQARDFRTKLTRFADDVLPAAGLVPSQGVGGVRAKIKLFIKSKYGVEDTKLLTVDKWAELLALLEKTEASEMVKLINQEIGAL